MHAHIHDGPDATIAAFASALASDVAVGFTSQWRTEMPRLLVDHHKAPLFTADRTVGRNAPNDRLDVLLVQFLLFLCTNNPKGFGAPIETLSAYDDLKVGRRVATPVFRATIAPTHPKPEGNIFIDGICGDQTISFIEYFQEQMLLRRRGVELNGQVAPQGTAGTTTMRLLNASLEVIPDPWMLTQALGFPRELQNAFYY